mgnify:FL=1
MNQRPAFETNGTLQIVIGAALLLFGLLAAFNTNASPLFAGLLFIGGLVMLIFGIIRAVQPRERATEDPHATPSDTDRSTSS